jgi:4-amino-4-deoxy-L-arabinose transferase-like glycosyltransferase
MVVVRISVIITSAASVILTYFLAKQMFGRDCALWAALFLSTSQLFVFFSTKALTEPLFISLVSLSLMFFLKGGKARFAIISGVFAGLALVTRYVGTILMVSYFLYFIFLLWKTRKKDDVKKTFIRFSLLLCGFALTIIPWLLLSYASYGSIFGAYFTNFAVYSGSFSSGITEYLTGFFEFSGPQVVFLIVGLYAALKVRKESRAQMPLMFLLFFIPIAFFSVAPHTEPRYLLSYAPVYALFSGLALTREFKAAGRSLQYLALLACAVCLVTGMSMVWNDRFTGKGLIEAAGYLKEITSEKDVIMTESYPYVYYFSGRRAVRFPAVQDDVAQAIAAQDVKYVLLYKFEPGNPEYTAQYFIGNDKFSRIVSFEQWGDQEAVIIYKVNP